MLDACMCLISVCSAACMPDCIMVLCMSVSSDCTLPPFRQWLFIFRGAIIPRQLFWMSCNMDLCVCVCTALLLSLVFYLKLMDHVFILLHSCSVPSCNCIARIVLITKRKVSAVWRQSRSWQSNRKVTDLPMESTFELVLSEYDTTTVINDTFTVCVTGRCSSVMFYNTVGLR